MKANRTELVFKMGRKLFKFATFKLNSLHKNMNVETGHQAGVDKAAELKNYQLVEIEQFKELIKVLPFDELTKVISGYNEIDIF